MKEFRDKVAVITGAASGIGRAIADRCAQERMKLVLADVEEGALARTEQELRAGGASVLAVQTDVAQADHVEALAQKSLDSFGGVHLLFNNAGVNAGTSVWESTLADWKWVMSVNLWGVIHGIRMFVPIMLKQDTECHIVNTASLAGLISGSALGIYKVTKHGVVSLSETLCCELAEINSKIKVSVLCPGVVNTRIMDSERNRPLELQNVDSSVNPEVAAHKQVLRELLEAGMPPVQLAQYVFEAIRAEQFYIVTHSDLKPMIQNRMEDILRERDPSKQISMSKHRSNSLSRSLDRVPWIPFSRINAGMLRARRRLIRALGG